MSFNLNSLVPKDTDQKSGSGQSFNVNSLVAKGTQASADLEQEKQSNTPDEYDTGTQNAWLNLADFFIPDSIMDIIASGGAQPFSTGAKTPIGHSMVYPERAEKMRSEMATNVLGEEKYLPLSNPELTMDQRARASTIAQMGDPFTYTGKGLVKMGLSALSQVAPTYVSSVASELAVGAAADADLSPTAQMAVGLTTGVLTGVTTGTIQTPMAFGVKKAGGATTTLFNAVKNRDKNIEAGAEMLTKSISKDVLAAQENLPQIISQAQRMAARLGYPDMKLAHIAPLVANPSLSRDFQAQYLKNPAFKTKIDEAVSEYNMVLKEYTQKFGGKPSSSARAMTKAIEDERKQILKAQTIKDQVLEVQQNKIEDSITEISEQLNVAGDSIESGQKIKNLQSAQQGIAQQNLSKGYKKILNEGAEQGVSMPSNNVGSLYNLHQTLQLKEMFGKGNRFSTLVDKLLKPKIEETGEFRPPTNPDEVKNPIPITREVFPEMTIEGIDSFKRELNLMLRDKNLSPSQRATLTDMKRGFDKQLSEADPDFAALYKAHDLRYLEEMGLPFDMAGVQAMSRAKFAQDATRKIMKPEVAQQFLAIAGKEGPEVLRHSIFIGLNNVIFKGGVFNPKALDNWMAKPDNKRLMSMVDGLESELSNKSGYVQSLQDQLVDVGIARKTVHLDQTDTLFKALDKNTNEVVKEILDNAEQRNKWFEAIDAMSPTNKAAVIDGISQRMVQKAMSHARAKGVTIMDHLTDPQYRPAYIKILGREGFKGLEALAIIGDSKAVLDLDRLQLGTSAKERQFGQSKLGVTIPNVTALWRRPMISGAQKVTILASMIGTKSFQNASDQKLIEFMLSPDFLKSVGKGVSLKDGKAFVNGQSQDLIMKLMEMEARGAYSGGQTGMNQVYTGEPTEERNR